MEGAHYVLSDMGGEDAAIVAVDGTDEQHAFLREQADVFFFPALDDTTGRQVDQLMEVCNVLGVPGFEVTSATTYREMLRGVLEFFKVMQRYQVHDIGGGGKLALASRAKVPFMELDTVGATFELSAIEHGADFADMKIAATLQDAVVRIQTRGRTQFTLMGIPI